MNLIKYKPIGIIHSPFKNLTGIPRQAVGAPDEEKGLRSEWRFLKRHIAFSKALV